MQFEMIKTCTKCKKELLANKDNFYSAPHGKFKLAAWCKICDNKIRSERWHSKKSHNIPCFCRYCGGFFYQARLMINKIKKWQKTQRPKLYCSRPCARLDGHRFKSWYGKRRGDNNPNAILDEKKVKCIKKYINLGLRNNKIAEMMEISKSTISQIKTGRSWSHIKV